MRERDKKGGGNKKEGREEGKQKRYAVERGERKKLNKSVKQGGKREVWRKDGKKTAKDGDGKGK